MAFPSLKEQTYSEHNALSLQCWAGWCGLFVRSSLAHLQCLSTLAVFSKAKWMWLVVVAVVVAVVPWAKKFRRSWDDHDARFALKSLKSAGSLLNMQFTDLPINFAWHGQFWVEHQLSSTAGHVFTDPDGPKVQALKAFGTTGTTDCGSWGDGKMIDGVDHT